MPSKNIAELSKSGLTNDQVISMPKTVSIQKTITNIRKPIGGKSLDNHPNDIVWVEEFKKTKDNERFLLFDSRVRYSNEPVFLIFASDRALNLLGECKNWSIDGTFFSCPKHFGQLYTLNVFKEESTLPIVYFLLPNKEQATYEKAFYEFFDMYPNFYPEFIMSGKKIKKKIKAFF